MSDIYEQHKAAFAQVSAYVILDKKGERVANVAFKLPKNGAGRLYAYVHLIGAKMVRGYANGYGYDKRSAAVESAMDKTPANFADTNEYAPAFFLALEKIGGSTWDRRLQDAGFTVYQAV